MKNYLLQLRKLDRMISNKLIEKEQWRDIALGVVAANSEGVRVQSSGSQQKMADAIDKCVDIEAEVNRHIDDLYSAKRDVLAVIERLDVQEYDLLHKVYVQYMELFEAAEAMGKSYSWATTVHGRALKHVRDILDERN